MKKTLVLSVLLIALVSVPVFSFGIGAAFGVDFIGSTAGPGALLSLKLDQHPAVFGVGFAIAENAFRLGFTADYWLWRANLIEILYLYLGPGVFIDVGLWDNGEGTFGVGLRIPIGLQAFIIDPLELFFEVAPTIGFAGGQFPAFNVQGAVGFRFWF